MNDSTRTELKCRILRVGTIGANADGSEYATGWVMDGEHSSVAAIFFDRKTGVTLIGGYTIDELKAIVTAAIPPED